MVDDRHAGAQLCGQPWFSEHHNRKDSVLQAKSQMVYQKTQIAKSKLGKGANCKKAQRLKYKLTSIIDPSCVTNLTKDKIKSKQKRG